MILVAIQAYRLGFSSWSSRVLRLTDIVGARCGRERHPKRRGRSRLCRRVRALLLTAERVAETYRTRSCTDRVHPHQLHLWMIQILYHHIYRCIYIYTYSRCIYIYMYVYIYIYMFEDLSEATWLRTAHPDKRLFFV